jgi:uncharacterized tellurite resistance protein B-like protein
MRKMLNNVGAALKGACSTARDKLRGAAASDRDEVGTGGGQKLRKCLEQMHLPTGRRKDSELPPDFGTPANPNVLNARVQIGREACGEEWRSVLILEICGTIQAPEEGHEASLEVALGDVTENPAQPLPVLNRPKQGPLQGSSHFVHETDMGKLCNTTTVLEDWTAVARLDPQWFVLPRTGSRKIQYDVSIISRQSGQPLAGARCTAVFENTNIGYLDIEANIQRTRTLAVGLAFSVAAADGQLPDPEVDVILGWVKTNFGSGSASSGAQLELERALQKTAAFFRRGGQINVQEVCEEIVEMAPMVGRLEIVDLCLRVAGAKGQVVSAELMALKDLAQWLQVDRTRLRVMIEKILPVHMHETQDTEIILGVTEEMTDEEARHQLNREYAKWSSRVISTDPAIRQQADEMVQLIAEARVQYVPPEPSR